MARWPATALTARESLARPSAFDGAGYKMLTSKAFLPPDFDQETFDNLWTVWEEPLRSQAEKATPESAARWLSRGTA